MNDMLKLLAVRRSVKPLAMTGPGPDASQLDEMLKLSARVPDHGKIAPWRFVVYEGAGRAHAGAEISRVFAVKNPAADADRLAIEANRFNHAPVVVAVVSRVKKDHPKVPVWEQELSAGAVCMNLTMAAAAMGFVTCWLTEWYAFDRDACAALGIGPDEKVAGFIHIGRNDQPQEDRERPDMSKIVTRFPA